ncbi:hemerythrin domain-containing protein [Herminiimonas sp. NPDC097707]|uniref:hemerythrin domain-containing protein n=1 Tax=Herminiimonas sp. NPDC097707 TaxID=3364007 RepID=UPI00383A610C
MTTINAYLNADHPSCDSPFSELEDHARAGNWRQTKETFLTLQQALEQHLGMEEEFLFPAFEKITGNRNGPTGIMRMEHGLIRNILVRMAYALAQRDAADFLHHADTLLTTLQQHNLKEENILRLMADCILLSKHVDIIDATTPRTAVSA